LNKIYKRSLAEERKCKIIFLNVDHFIVEVHAFAKSAVFFCNRTALSALLARSVEQKKVLEMHFSTTER